ncbi:MAG: hypothetical protein P4M11_07230 [Candidatus Pacebacteria bacterium]|nr:hypothetical protein [Candidatus Paceibacterota bacterium]
MADKTEKACLSCGSIAPAVYKRRWSLVLAIILFFFGFFPGVIYLLLVLVTRKPIPVCAVCKRATLVPAASPQGIKIKEQFSKNVSPLVAA